MNKRKLLERVRNNPKDVRFSDLVSLVESFGYVLRRRSNGSHRFFTHRETQHVLNLQSGKHGKAKAYQVKEFLEAVDTFGLVLGEEE